MGARARDTNGLMEGAGDATFEKVGKTFWVGKGMVRLADGGRVGNQTATALWSGQPQLSVRDSESSLSARRWLVVISFARSQIANEKPPKAAMRFRRLVLVERRFVHNRAANPSGGFVRLSGCREIGNRARLSSLRRRQSQSSKVNLDSLSSSQDFVISSVLPLDEP